MTKTITYTCAHCRQTVTATVVVGPRPFLESEGQKPAPPSRRLVPCPRCGKMNSVVA